MAENRIKGTSLFSPYKMGKFSLSHRSVHPTFSQVLTAGLIQLLVSISDIKKKKSFRRSKSRERSGRAFLSSDFCYYVTELSMDTGWCWRPWQDAGRCLGYQGMRWWSTTRRDQLLADFSSAKALSSLQLLPGNFIIFSSIDGDLFIFAPPWQMLWSDWGLLWWWWWWASYLFVYGWWCRVSWDTYMQFKNIKFKTFWKFEDIKVIRCLNYQLFKYLIFNSNLHEYMNY
jgi:hypothetical protein